MKKEQNPGNQKPQGANQTAPDPRPQKPPMLETSTNSEKSPTMIRKGE